MKYSGGVGKSFTPFYHYHQASVELPTFEDSESE